MDPKVEVAIIAGVVGLLGGVVGSLVAPWVQWGIEKRRSTRNRRLECLTQWCEFVSTEFNQATFKETSTFRTLRPYLSPELIQKIENETIYASLVGGDPIRKELLNELTELERKWRLI